ncbi:MAG: hypothetical protein ACLGJB_00355 [Blastocatellia bacterium]
METTEKIVESYCRYVKQWFTIPNIKCKGQYEIDLLAGQANWPHLKQVFKIEREVEELTSGKKRSEVSYEVTSLSDKQANAEKLLEVVRKHWMIENGLHYGRGWTLREDYCRLRIGDAAQAMAVINNLVVGLTLRQGFKYLPDARRKYNAQPLEGLKLILRR